MIKLKLLLGQWLAKLTRKLKNNFYIYLASLLTILVLLDASVFHVGLNMRDKAFDFMVKHRVIQAKADPQIIIVDINEASLAAFSKEYGRWPWPRQVLGEFLENIQAQKPKAIVFDIVFSDADIYNPDSDAYFNDVIGASDNVFFPILRLDPTQDKLSQLKYAQIPGIQPYPDHNQNATVAAILPFFEGAQKQNRLGTHNVYPDNDGIVREYRIYQTDEGWHLPSLPEVVGKYAGGSLVDVPQNMLLNWRGKPFSYQYVTFSDVFTDLTSQHKKRSQSEFTDKIVIIGSTAAGLFDIKPTAMDKQFPGVEVLATAIDNVKHGDYLKVWRGKTPYIILSLLLIWVTTLAFYFKVDRDKFNSIFTGSQVGLLALSYIGINVSNTYLDLTGPILWAVALFGIAKIYALATDRALQRWLTFGVQANADHTCVLMLAASIESDEPLGDVVMKKLKRKLELTGTTPSTVEVLLGTQTGIWGLFGDMVIVSWLYSDEKPEYKTTAQQDARRMMDILPAHIEALGLPKQTLIRYASHEGKLLQSNIPANSQTLGAQWRTLFAQLIIQLEHGDRAETKDIP